MKVVLARTVRRVMELLAGEDYYGLEALTGGVRLSAREIEQAIRDSSRTVALPPPEGYDQLEAIEVIAALDTWSVDMPIWTAEVGRSDLSVAMTIIVRNGEATIELDGIHVL